MVASRTVLFCYNWKRQIEDSFCLMLRISFVGKWNCPLNLISHKRFFQILAQCINMFFCRHSAFCLQFEPNYTGLKLPFRLHVLQSSEYLSPSKSSLDFRYTLDPIESLVIDHLQPATRAWAICEPDKISEHGASRNRTSRWRWKLRNKKFRRFLSFRREGGRVSVCTAYPEFIQSFPVFVSKRERHARRGAVAVPRIAFRSSKSRNFVPRNAPSLTHFLPVSFGLSSTESAWHACRCTRARMHADRSPPPPSRERCNRECAASACQCLKWERNFFFPSSSPFFLSWLTPCVALRIPFGSRSPKRLSYLFATWILYLLSLPPLLLHLPNKFTSGMYTIIAARTFRW